MIEGEWRADELGVDADGYFRRHATSFHARVAPAAVRPGRFRLYVSYACPWAHRTLMARALYGLTEAVEVCVVHPLMGDEGWTFAPGPGVVPDPEGTPRLQDLYRRVDSNYTGRVTVPVLWDTERQTIVNNESREIVRMFGETFAALGHGRVDLCPPHLRAAIDEVADAIYEPVNNGVYKAGFARSQAAYDDAVGELVAALEHWERVLGEQRYLCGDRLTEADLFLFTTLIRFDPVYHTHFKCTRRRLVEYANLWGYTRELYQLPGVAETVALMCTLRSYNDFKISQLA